MKSIFKVLPKEVVLLIWSFDNTYTNIYNKCLVDVIKTVKIYNSYWRKGYRISFSRELNKIILTKSSHNTI